MARKLATALGLSLALAAGACSADTPRAPADAAVWMTVGDATLETMRGGFDLGGGVMVSFGISRVISVNGVLMASTAFHVPDLGRVTPAQATAFERHVGSASLVQVGSGNVAPSGAAAVPAAVIVQNTLNDQSIQTRTVIDTTTNGMSLAKGLNAGAALQDALVRAVPAR